VPTRKRHGRKAEEKTCKSFKDFFVWNKPLFLYGVGKIETSSTHLVKVAILSTIRIKIRDGFLA
jgi:hypothetical protein